MPDQREVIADLIADGEEVDGMVAHLDAGQWELPTPAPGWTVAHQVAHLTASFNLAAVAAVSPSAFQAVSAKLGGDFDAKVAAAMAPFLAHPPGVLLDRWRTERAAAEQALARLPGDQLVPWLARPLAARMLAAAGMMELFAHGQDIADTLRLPRRRTDRLRRVVEFALGNWDFGYLVRGLEPPEVALRFELTAPSGAVWRYGPAGAAERVAGPALDFCLLVARRRHRADLALTATGDQADRWLDLAQGYRGAPGPGRTPGQFRGQLRHG